MRWKGSTLEVLSYKFDQDLIIKMTECSISRRLVKSTEEQKELATSDLNWNMKTDFLFLDVAKASDRVWHDKLIQKINQLGYSLDITQILILFLANRQIRVWIGHEYFEYQGLEPGVPQYAVLSPLPLQYLHIGYNVPEDRNWLEICRWYRHRKLLLPNECRHQETTGLSGHDIELVYRLEDCHQLGQFLLMQSRRRTPHQKNKSWS